MKPLAYNMLCTRAYAVYTHMWNVRVRIRLLYGMRAGVCVSEWRV